MDSLVRTALPGARLSLSNFRTLLTKKFSQPQMTTRSSLTSSRPGTSAPLHSFEAHPSLNLTASVLTTCCGRSLSYSPNSPASPFTTRPGLLRMTPVRKLLRISSLPGRLSSSSIVSRCVGPKPSISKRCCYSATIASTMRTLMSASKQSKSKGPTYPHRPRSAAR